jgi:uncharacterized protein
MLMTQDSYALPLFPLGSVLFPDGLLRLRVFEARYLDLMTACIKTDAPFGVVLIRQGAEVHVSGDRAPQLETIGCLAKLTSWDMDTPGLMTVNARGIRRFATSKLSEQKNGLLVATVNDVLADEPKAVPEVLAYAARALRQVVDSIEAQQAGASPFMKPYNYESSTWVSNRWCEVLPIPITARQKLMELPDAVARLEIVASFLKQRGIAT